MTSTSYPTVSLVPGGEKRLKRGSPWVFSNEIAMNAATRDLSPGTLVHVVTAQGAPLGVAGFNPHSLIAARIYSHSPDTVVDQAFLSDRLTKALVLRDRLFQAPYYRLIHAEADGLPGTIIDRHNDIVVVQPNTATAQHLLPALMDALRDLLQPTAIIVRADSPSRQFEGLESTVEIIDGPIPERIRVAEGGVHFAIDPIAGQKTGWFYDQRANRAFTASLATERTVLDVYGNSGGFALQALASGATQATLVDRSEPAVSDALESARINGLENRLTTRKTEAFAEMGRQAQAGNAYDVVVVDPPAFAKVKKDVPTALRGYRKMARLAASLVAPDGILVACSCSHHIGVEAFVSEISRGVHLAGRTGQRLRLAGADADHPVHLGLPETDYLKALTIRLDC